MGVYPQKKARFYTYICRNMMHFRLSTSSQLPAYQYAYGNKTASGVCMQSASDYSPFGVLLEGRTMEGEGYRYGMNSQEKADEISGAGNHYTATHWEYDPRLGRRWNQDPKPNPSISNYAAFANNSIWYSDPLGDTIRVTTANQDYFMEDLTAVFGQDASLLFEFDKNNNLTFTRAGQIKSYREQSLGTNKGDLYTGVLTLVNSEEVTNIVYTNKEITNPETGQPYENDKGQKLTSPVQKSGGEATITISDAKTQKLKNVSQNTVFISIDKVHSPGLYDDPRENNTFHGMGHVLYQKNSEQEKVIDFDNKSRRERNAPLRPVDSGHKNKPDNN